MSKKTTETTAVALQNPFGLIVSNNFQFIKPMNLGANEYRFDAGKNQFLRNGVELEKKRIKMHVFYISPILYADTYFLFNPNQEKRTQWIELGFFDEEGKFGTICTYDFAIKSLYNTIKELPEGVVCSQDEAGGIFLFATLQWEGLKKEKGLVDGAGNASNATYYVPVFTHLPDFPESLQNDYKAIFEKPENMPFLFALQASYRLLTAPRFDRETKLRIN